MARFPDWENQEAEVGARKHCTPPPMKRVQLEIPSPRKERERLARPPVALNNKLTCGESRMIHEPSRLFSPSNYRGCRIHKSSEPLNGR